MNCQESGGLGVIGHRVRSNPGELTDVDGVPVTAPPRTWLDLAADLPLNYLIALGDQIIEGSPAGP